MKTLDYQWQTKQQLTELLCDLVKIPSITHTVEEIKFAEYIESKIRKLPYFQVNPEYVKVHKTKDQRKFVTALVKSEKNVQDTIILVSHFDVVGVDDYGSLKELAFHPINLTKFIYENKTKVPEAVQKDIREGDWLFGRGTMDMKCGLALHMSIIEEACNGNYDGNILLLTVCDEEVNSVGMREAVSVLLEMSKQYNLKYNACINSEPVFSRYPGDENNYLYLGSLGKILAGFLCYGKETHVGEPFSGLNANYMASELTRELEFNTDYCEKVGDEVTPPPTVLIQKDLKNEYNVQISHRSVNLFNLFLMEKSIDEIVEQLSQTANKVAKKIENHYSKSSIQFSTLEGSHNNKDISVTTLRFEELLRYALETYGEKKVMQIKEDVLKNKGQKDDRELAIEWVDRLATLCKELAPMIIIFFAPPYYPPVNSRKHPEINRVVDYILTFAKQNYDIELKKQNYFAGISDLSYTGLSHPTSSIKSLTSNMPNWNHGYTIPFDALEELNLPVLNLGPIGRDAHKWTERLDLNYAFHILRNLLSVTIKQFFQK
jgi:arginine utilization protein RocB